MAQSPLTIKVPGKLMIAGEYAVLDQYQRLVVMAADKYLFATIEDSEQNKLNLANFDLYHIGWTFDDDTVHMETEDTRVAFVQQAIQTALTYLREQEIAFGPFTLEIRSELESVDGAKYGLGSSAAAVTAAVSAILHRFLPEPPTEELVFKLAAIAHVSIQRNGSGADIAAASYGGWLAYASFQAEWLLGELEKKQSLTRLVKKNWQYLKIEKLDFPEGLHVCVGWTGKPASTKELVSQVRKMKHEKHADYAGFMVQSGTAVQGIMHGIKENDPAIILEGIQLNRQALAKLGADADVDIETAELKILCDLAEEFGGAGKPSGAGGGDCGIAFMPTEKQKADLEAAWEKAGITPLAIHPQKTGAAHI